MGWREGVGVDERENQIDSVCVRERERKRERESEREREIRLNTNLLRVEA